MKVTDEDAEVEISVLDLESGKPTGEKRRAKRIVAGSNRKVWPTLKPEEHEARDGGGRRRGRAISI
jgi:hypothetical protein